MKADVEMSHEQCDRALKDYLLTLETINQKGFIYLPRIKNYRIVESTVEKKNGS